jgi:hypothetical protein
MHIDDLLHHLTITQLKMQMERLFGTVEDKIAALKVNPSLWRQDQLKNTSGLLKALTCKKFPIDNDSHY